MAEILSSVAETLAQYTVGPILRQIKILFLYNRNIKNLKGTVQDLENKRDDVKADVDAALNNGEVIGKEVSDWLQRVDDLKKKADKILNGEVGSETRCLLNRGANLKSRYLLSRRATRETIVACKLKDEVAFYSLSHPPPPGQASNPTPHGERGSIKKKIKEALKDNENSIIGIYGTNVDDNTALAREIEKDVKDENLFLVAFEDVSAYLEILDLNKIQERLPKGIEGKRIIVILDDVVSKEIVFGANEILPSPQELKIMFTTPNKDIFTKIKVDKKYDLAGISDDEDRSSTKKKVKEALEDKKISIIGICGMPGIGKTTLAKEIGNEVKDKKLFDDFAFAVVSEHPDIEKIQDQLADSLGLTIKEKTNKDVRAERLRCRLESKETVLVILDDVWKEIDLETIGIPSPRDRKGLKIMFTTRIEDTCTQMEVDKKVEIKVLGQNEGWKILKHTARISDDGTDVELVRTAKKVAYECGGLPLALVVVGKALKCEKAAHKWRDALQQLQNSSVTNLEGMHKLVYSKIELSYNYLESNEDRELLLLCSLFGEHKSIPIENLFRYARGLDLFPNTGTLNETRDRLYSITDNLKSCYLLQPGKKEDEVKLHDVIRDFCLQMATKDKCGYLVNHAGLKEWPELDADKSYRAVSITFDRPDQLPGELKYRNVKLLRVICHSMGEGNNSEEFFQGMNELRVLELKRMPFPSSIQLLTGLRTLCLISCELDSQLSMIGSLKKLEILCLYDSYFGDSVPKESANLKILNLSNLKSLDLRSRKPIPLLPGVLSGMKKLEELYLGRYIPMEGEDQRYIIIEELRSLTSLRAFQISTGDTQILKQILGALSLENLETFQIIKIPRLAFLSRIKDSTTDRVTRGLYLNVGFRDNPLLSFLHGSYKEKSVVPSLQPEINSLMKRTYHLQINDFKSLKNLVSELDGDGFIELKTLEVSYCVDFEYLMDATNSIPSGTFGKLESLDLRRLPKLKEICNGNLPRGVVKPLLFCNLMKVSMHYCDAIRNLFHESVAKCLVNLQILDIYRCLMLEEVVYAEGEGEEVTKPCRMLEFPKLKTISLWLLRRFKRFTSQTLFNQVTFPNMERLSLYRLDCIVKLFGKEMPITSPHKLRDIDVVQCVTLLPIAESDSIQLLPNLHDLDVTTCDELQVLFDFEGIKVTDDPEINMFDGLKTLEIESLPKLVYITRMVPKGIRVFQNLTKLTVEDCKSLRYLFPPSIVNSVEALEHLSIENCEALEEIIGREEEDNDGNLVTLFNQVTLPNLKYLAENSSKSLQNLKRVEVKGCKALEVLFDFECLTVTKNAKSALGRLRSLELKSLDKLVHITRMVPKGIRVFKNLINLTVEDCKSLRYLFSPSIVNLHEALESLSIKDCVALEEIIESEEEEEENNDGILRTFFNQVTLPNLKYLVIKGLQYIVKLVSIIRVENSSISLQNLESLVIEDCKALEVLFDFECLTITNDRAETVLRRVRSLELKSLEKLVCITRMVPKGIRVFQNLTLLVVERCGSLKYLFSPSMANSLGALENLRVSDCELIEGIVGKEEEEEEGTSKTRETVEGMKIRIVLPNLNLLLLKNLPRIQMFCPQNSELDFPSMKEYLTVEKTVENCPMMPKLSPWPVSTHFRSVG